MIRVRRYSPLLLLAIAQLVLAIALPSRAPAPTLAPPPLALAAPSADPGADAGAAADGSTGSVAAGAGGTRPAASGGGGGAAGVSAALPGTGRAGADTHHCAGGLQFGGLLVAPPCAPRWGGGDNGGDTSQGVTRTAIEVVLYRPKRNAAVDAIISSQGISSSPQQEQDFRDRATTFINTHYELSGRRVHLDVFQGQCEFAPPDIPCLRNEVDTAAATYHPFAAMWFSVAGEVYDELSRKGIISFGGLSNSFNIAHRPYLYGMLMGQDEQAVLASEYWCKKLANQPARFAGDPLLQRLPRKVAIVADDLDILRPALDQLQAGIQRCDRNGAQMALYSLDTSTAVAQSTTLMAKLKSSNVTTIMWAGDPIFPVFGTHAATSQAYFPENVMEGGGLMDIDILARAYDPQQWQHAFGISDLPAFQSVDRSDGAKVYRATGGTGPVPLAAFGWTGYAMIANSLQLAGPALTPLTFERATLTSPSYGGWRTVHDPHVPYLHFAPGKYTWISDAREVYWSASATSEFDGKPGAYQQLNGGQRYVAGEWTAGEPNLPAGV
ncbi:MAG TPA: hypothetical protein VGP96_16850 [Candidatus Dormibacteraeota bacterium]|nr:hypothetical protein [Candidatus Dormibacteraeota bacterium]